ncbi:7383_t:CDS:2, partial [Acaulospora morrowiae]
MNDVEHNSSFKSVKREVYINVGNHECSEKYCSKCVRKFFQEQPSHWTSGNLEIDKIIRESQKGAWRLDVILEWIPFEQFYNLRRIDEGAFGIVYSAYWRDGPLDIEKKDTFSIFYREGPIKVILKKLKKSQNISVEFINELKVHHKLYCQDFSTNVIRLFGISKDPTDGEFYMVLEY